MTTMHHEIVVWRVDEWRYAISLDGLVRYVGSREECDRRAAILATRNNRAAQDEAVTRLAFLLG